jgi:hypothetical protein
MRTARHPSGRIITFTEKFHSYSVDKRKLRSVSSLLEKYFPFDADRTAALVAAKTKVSTEDVLKSWRMSAVLGTNVHAHIEALLLRQPRKPVEAVQGEEEDFYPAATAAAMKIAKHYDVVAIEAMIASPKLGIAGTVDFIGRNKKTGQILICDWKTTTSALSAFKFGSFDDPVPLPPFQHLTNSKTWRYSLQTLIYGHILRTEGYDAIYGESVTKLPMEYGIAQMGRLETGPVGTHFTRVTPESVLPRDYSAEQSVDSLLSHLTKPRVE